MVASTGGHLAQLHRLRPRLVGPTERLLWITFDSPQSRSLLRDENVEYVTYTAPRDWRSVAANTPSAAHILRRHRVRRLYTTGSAIALSFLPIARLAGIECHYIESAARSDGPSMTGRIAARTPGVRTYTQYRALASARWQQAPSVFDDFEPSTASRDAQLRRVVVTLGTIEGYPFLSLVQRLLTLLPPDAEVLWQTGDTDVTGFPIDGLVVMPHSALAAAMRDADLVVAHAGIGSALSALQAGRLPLLVPRRRSRQEHVDDHQIQIARELAQRRLAVYREVDSLTVDDLLHAARGSVHPVQQAPPPPTR